jgi:hypothetical protein
MSLFEGQDVKRKMEKEVEKTAANEKRKKIKQAIKNELGVIMNGILCYSEAEAGPRSVFIVFDSDYRIETIERVLRNGKYPKFSSEHIELKCRNFYDYADSKDFNGKEFISVKSHHKLKKDIMDEVELKLNEVE